MFSMLVVFERFLRFYDDVTYNRYMFWIVTDSEGDVKIFLDFLISYVHDPQTSGKACGVFKKHIFYLVDG